MLENKINSFTTFSQPTNYDAIGRVTFKEARILPYLVAKDIFTQAPIPFNEAEIKKTVSMQFTSFRQPLIFDIKDVNTYALSVQGVKQCTREDFSGMGYGDVYDNISPAYQQAMICPEDVSALVVQNNYEKHSGVKEYIYTYFRVDRCRKEDNPDCKDDAEA